MSASDVVYLKGLQLNAIVGNDAWHRPERQQPVVLDVRMRTDIQLAGDKDDVIHTVHYGNLCKAITKEVESGKTFASLVHLAKAVCTASFRPGGCKDEMELTITLPKGILLGDGVGLSASFHRNRMFEKPAEDLSLFARGMKLTCIIGVNEYERLEKQYVVLSLRLSDIEQDIFTEYPPLLKEISDVSLQALKSTHLRLITYVVRGGIFV